MLASMALLLSAGPGLAADAMLKDFVSFDRAFITVFVQTGEKKRDPAKKGFEIVKSTWAGFKKRHYKAWPKDANWKQDLDTVELKIQEAERVILGEGDLADAHAILESIRFALMNLRKRNGIGYYLDHLTEFHEHMEAILHTTSGKDAGSFTDNDQNLVARECGDAVTVWGRIQSLPFEKELFGFGDREEALANELMKGESQALRNLQNAVDGKNMVLIIKSAGEIRPCYELFYKMFGQFPEAENTGR